jgi:DNA-directed RNA polymerase specialized sigma24 family protein
MSNHTTTLRFWISRHAQGDARATNELLRHSERRFLEIIRARLPQWDRLRRFEDSQDILAQAQVRFARAIRAVTCRTLDDFLRLGAWVIRNQICDSAGRYFGPTGAGANEVHLSGDPSGSGPAIAAPATSTLGAELDEAIGRLSDGPREMFDLLYYQGLTQPEAAGHLGASVSTVQRRWIEAKIAFMAIYAGDDATDFPEF